MPAPRPGVAGAPVDQVQGRIIRADVPRRATPGLPGLALPGVVAGLAGGRNGVGLPHQVARVLVVRLDGAAHAVLAAGEAGDDQVLVDDRRRRDGMTGLVIDRGARPQLIAAVAMAR